MKNSIKTFLFASLSIIGGCSKSPSACFTFSGSSSSSSSSSYSSNTTTFEAGQTISFKNCAEYTESYLWDFGDGETSDEDDPKHVYTNGGVFNVVLKCTNGSKTHSKTLPVFVKAKTATKAFIKKITIQGFPSKDSYGYSWDDYNGKADLQIVLKQSSEIYNSYSDDAMVFTNANSDSTYVFEPSTPVEVSLLGDSYCYFIVADYDYSSYYTPYEAIKSIFHTFALETLAYPTSVSYSIGTEDQKMIIELSYQ